MTQFHFDATLITQNALQFPQPTIFSCWNVAEAPFHGILKLE